MFRQFVSARTHRATTGLLAYVCVFICMQSINQSINDCTLQVKEMECSLVLFLTLQSNAAIKCNSMPGIEYLTVSEQLFNILNFSFSATMYQNQLLKCSWRLRLNNVLISLVIVCVCILHQCLWILAFIVFELELDDAFVKMMKCSLILC